MESGSNEECQYVPYSFYGKCPGNRQCIIFFKCVGQEMLKKQQVCQEAFTKK